MIFYFSHIIQTKIPLNIWKACFYLIFLIPFRKTLTIQRPKNQITIKWVSDFFIGFKTILFSLFLLNVKISSNAINLLICKLCSTSLSQLNSEMIYSVFEYSLNSLDVSQTQNQSKISTNELQTILKLTETIFKSFTRNGISIENLIFLK